MYAWALTCWSPLLLLVLSASMLGSLGLALLWAFWVLVHPLWAKHNTIKLYILPWWLQFSMTNCTYIHVLFIQVILLIFMVTSMHVLSFSILWQYKAMYIYTSLIMLKLFLWIIKSNFSPLNFKFKLSLQSIAKCHKIHPIKLNLHYLLNHDLHTQGKKDKLCMVLYNEHDESSALTLSTLKSTLLQKKK